MVSRESGPSYGLLMLGAAGLFLIWSNSFVAIEYLLHDGDSPRLDWVAVAVARFGPVPVICLGYCFFFRRRETLDLLRAHPARALLSALFAVPAYNFALGAGQQLGVPAPLASLTTTLAPLFILLLSVWYLGERLTRDRLLGLLCSLVGMVIIAGGRMDAGDEGFGLALAVTSLAPLSWALFSIASKPVTERRGALLWTFLITGLGSLLLWPLFPGSVAAQIASLDLAGWLAVLYLTFPCTILGFVIWTWLLRHLPASAVGMTVFMNPPMTTLSKLVLAALFPATFAFTLGARDAIGGLLVLVGLGISLRLPQEVRSP